MNFKQENRLKMYLALRIFLRLNPDITSKLPNFDEFFTALDNAIIMIQTNSEQQHYDISGVTENKNLLRNAVIGITVDASHKMQAHAKYTSNPTLQNETKFTESSLKGFSDIEIVDVSRGLYSKINSNLTSLTAYGLTDISQKDFLKAIDDFNESIPKRRQSQVNKKENTLLINKGVAIADKAIENIDIVVEIVCLTQPTFYADYKATRKVIDMAGSSLSVKGKVTDAATGNPIKDATLIFCLSGNNDVVMGKKTAEKGGYMIKSLDEGEYTVTISKVGYQSQTVEFIVNSSELCELNVALQKK